MITSVEQLFTEIASRYGGVDRLSLADAAIAKALAVELSRDALDPRAIADLGHLLPSPPSSGPQHLDLGKLSDDDLSALEAMHEKAGISGPAPDPGSERATIRELLDMNDKLQDMCIHKDAVHAADQSEIAMANRMWKESRDENERLRAEIERLRQERAEAQGAIPTPADENNASVVDPLHVPGPSGERAPNVVPLRGSGSAVVNGDLHERYPHLASTPPVDRW
jgi:hypothetical protein